MKIKNFELEIGFNPSPPTVMHVDINSCFATVEQQANPFYRGRPLVVAAYTTGKGCILAASVEAKRLGIKTGMYVRDGKAIYPKLIVLSPDAPKYRAVNKALYTVLSSYTPEVSIESIDEMVINLQGSVYERNMVGAAYDIKKRVKNEIGEWITVSIGVAPNRYLAKVASGLHKPDGLDFITRENITDIFTKLKLEDLCGIKEGNAHRLRLARIFTPVDMLTATPERLQGAMRSIVGYHWYLRLHGWDPSTGSGQETGLQKSFGQSFAMGHPHTPNEKETHQILSQLVVKMGHRLRADGFATRGVAVSCYFRDHTSWGARVINKNSLFADSDIYKGAQSLLQAAPKREIRILAVWCYNLTHTLYDQQSLFAEDRKKEQLTQALDSIADRFGEFVVTPGRMLSMEQRVLDRIAFGGGKGLQKSITSF